MPVYKKSNLSQFYHISGRPARHQGRVHTETPGHTPCQQVVKILILDVQIRLDQGLPHNDVHHPYLHPGITRDSKLYQHAEDKMGGRCRVDLIMVGGKGGELLITMRYYLNRKLFF